MARILVADDDELMACLIGAHLEAAGHAVTVVGDGRAALDQVEADRPDAIILDAVMPVLGGLEALRHLRAKPGTAALPVMMLTARNSEEDRADFAQAGADEYLPKPFDAPELVMRLEIMLRKAARAL